MKIYIVICYRWGCTNDHWYWLYAGPDEVKACAMAESEQHGRGGKYGCAVYVTNDAGDEWTLHQYNGGSRDGESEPTHNYNLDMYERLGHVLAQYCNGSLSVPKEATPNELMRVEVKPDPQLVEQFERISIMHAKMQAARDSVRREALERASKIACTFCDAWPVYDVEYDLEVLRVPRNEDGGSVVVEGLHGTYCRRCEQLWQRAEDQIGFNQTRIYIARKGATHGQQ